MASIVVQNRQRKIAVDPPALQRFSHRALEAVLGLPPLPGDVLSELDEISVALLSDRAIAGFHVRFMNIPGPTDVLTFEHGEILISAQTAAQHAVDYGHTTQEEVALYVLHGLLHLRGYDDTTPTAHEQMHRIQSELFAKLR